VHLVQNPLVVFRVNVRFGDDSCELPLGVFEGAVLLRGFAEHQQIVDFLAIQRPRCRLILVLMVLPLRPLCRLAVDFFEVFDLFLHFLDNFLHSIGAVALLMQVILPLVKHPFVLRTQHLHDRRQHPRVLVRLGSHSLKHRLMLRVDLFNFPLMFLFLEQKLPVHLLLQLLQHPFPRVLNAGDAGHGLFEVVFVETFVHPAV